MSATQLKLTSLEDIWHYIIFNYFNHWKHTLSLYMLLTFKKLFEGLLLFDFLEISAE